MSKKWFTNEQTLDIINLYINDNKSINFISNKYNVDNRVVKRILIENKIKIRDTNYYKSKQFNNCYFDNIDSEEKAYWLGFIYADGCISKRKSQDAFEIKLKDSDKEHLEKLKYCLQSSHKILERCENTPYCQNYKSVSLSICNQHFVDSLFNKGVLYNKSKILQPPTIDQVPEKFINHFIRGYFDGDGSIYEYSKTHAGSISFIGTESVLNWILFQLKQVVQTNAKISKYKNKDIYKLTLGGAKIISKIYYYLYKDSTIWLNRKKSKYEYILNKNKIDVQRL